MSFRSSRGLESNVRVTDLAAGPLLQYDGLGHGSAMEGRASGREQDVP